MIPSFLPYTQKKQKIYSVVIPDDPEDFDDPQPGDYMDKLDWTKIEFDADLEPGTQPVFLTVKNVASNIYVTPGTIMAFKIPALFPETITWTDSLAIDTGIIYEFMKTGNEKKPVGNKIKLEIRRLSGPDNLYTRQIEEAEQDEQDALEEEGDTPEEAEEKAHDSTSPYQQDGILTFSIVYYYN